MFDGDADFSIVSAVHNKSESLLDYVRFIRKQDFSGSIELILIDDASVDDSTLIMAWLKRTYESEKLRFRIIRHDINLGNCVSRNRGILASTGKYICIIDADCCLSA